MSEFVVSDLVAKLRLDKGSYDSDLNASKGSMDRFAEGARRAGDTIKRNVAGGLTAASVVTGVVAGGTLALLTNLTKTGAAYNMLQQGSRAALTTLMGGAEKANVQMDKLDDFARNSPFAKDVFIKAQQQLIGFGVEAKKVIPTMDAVQQAVAATGGASADVGAVVEVLAKISSTGKMTAEDLNMLGGRGINAAELIGKSMGKTGAEIRTAITKGTIGADEALDALTKGMATKFAGSTALIKQQMAGALDRIKGASRDIGSALAEPFIKAKGGGRAVVWANEFADVLRAAEKKTAPLVNMLVQRLNPAFNQLSYHMQDIKGWIDRIDVRTISDGLDGMGKHAPAIAGVATAFAAMGTQLPILSRLGLSVNPLVAGIAALVAASPELRGVLMDAVAAGKPLLPVIEQLAIHFSKGLNTAIGAAVPLLESGVDVFGKMVGAADPLVDMIGNLVEWFGELPGPAQTAVVAFAAFAALRGKFDWMGDLGKQLGGSVKQGFQTFRDEVRMTTEAANGMKFPGAGDALKVLDRQIGTTVRTSSTKLGTLGAVATTAGRTITRGLKGAATGLMGLFGGPWGIALGAGIMAVSAFSAAQAEARQRVEEFRGTLDESTGAITKNTDAMVASALVGDEGSKGFYLWSSGAEAASETLKVLGKSTQDTAAIVAAGGSDYDSMIEKLKGFEEASAASGNQFDAMGNIIGSGDGGAALQAWADTMGITSDQMNQLSTVDIVHLIGTLETQRGAVEGATGTWERMNDSMAATPDATSRIADAISAVGDAAGDATGRLQAYKDIIDIMNGITPSAEESQRKLAATTRTLGEFFKETDENGKLLNKGLIDSKTGAIALSDAGDRLNGILRPQADAALAAAIAASDHAKAMGDEEGAAAAADAALAPMRQTIQGLARDGLITKDQADALSKSLLGVPEKTSAVITDEGSVEALKLKLTDIAKQIEATPDGEITIKENSPEVIGALRDLGFTVTELPDGVIRVTEKGADQTGNRIDGVAGKKRTAPISVKEIGAAAAGNAIDYQARARYAKIYVQEVATNTVRAGLESAKYGQGRYDTGGYTGVGGKYEPAGIVHKDEFVVRKESRKRFEAENPGALDHLNKYGILPGFANGGRVNAAATAVKSARKELDRAKAAERAAKRTKSESDDKRAQQRVERAQKAFDAADSMHKDLVSKQFDTRQDLRRGNIRGDLSSVDQMFDWAQSGSFSKSASRQLTSSAYSTQSQFLKLEKQSESLAIKLGIATKRRDELLNVKEGVQRQLSGEFGLSTMMQWGTLKNGPLTAKDIAKGATEKLGQIKTFVNRLNALRKKGYSAMVIQDVASLGTNEGTMAADALLAGNALEVKQINSAFYGIDKFAGEAGESVTQSMYKGGQNAAQGLVSGIESQQRQVETAFQKLARQAENAFKRALGIHSPSTVFEARAGDTADGYIIGMEKRRKDVERAMLAMAQVPQQLGAMNVNQDAMLRNFNPNEQRVVHQENTFYYPIAEATSKGVERANQLANL